MPWRIISVAVDHWRHRLVRIIELGFLAVVVVVVIAVHVFVGWISGVLRGWRIVACGVPKEEDRPLGCIKVLVPKFRPRNCANVEHNAAKRMFPHDYITFSLGNNILESRIIFHYIHGDTLEEDKMIEYLIWKADCSQLLDERKHCGTTWWCSCDTLGR